MTTFSDISDAVKETITGTEYDRSTIADDVIFLEQFSRMRTALTRQLLVEQIKQEAKKTGKLTREVFVKFVAQLNDIFHPSFVEHGYLQFSTDKDRAMLDYVTKMGYDLFIEELKNLVSEVAPM